MENILLIDKPKGLTSFGVVRELRKKLGVKKIGHAGTLDPNATGLLVIGVGKGTKELKNLVGLDKEYEADILLGLKTDTGDVEGQVLEEEKVSVDEKVAREVVKNMVGKHILPVSKYSSTKIGGTPAHRLARRGEMVPNLKREMEVLKSEFSKLSQGNDHPVLCVKLRVTSGTYIRSIAEEVGRRLNVPATLRNLRRTKVGKFSLKDSEQL